MAENLFDLDVQVNKSQGSVEPQVLSIVACSSGKTAASCVETCGNRCFTNIGSLC
ncbi:FDLD family class I lanthipeptide [Paenibacillus kribbensis]|uniref:FDLD family class I lanthipeptide n=1 Tax=Paenibacillus kribbensis TaxID=172713 RepID=UPI001C3FFCA5|nr:FDLD family class I lanthipeptide [Paenibacillus kribbensis]